MTPNSRADKPVPLLKYTNAYEGRVKNIFTMTGKNFEILENSKIDWMTITKNSYNDLSLRNTTLLCRIPFKWPCEEFYSRFFRFYPLM